MSDLNLCQRCKDSEATVTSRKDFFCSKCFQKFVSLKQRRQMMSDQYFQDVFKVMYQDKKKSAAEADKLNKESRVLVPVSLGSSSLVLFDILNDYLLEQKVTHRGKTGFQVHVLTCCFGDEALEVKRRIAALKENEKTLKNKDEITFHLLDMNTFFSNSKELVTILLNFEDYSSTLIPDKSQVSIGDLLDSCPNKSAREDLLSVITTHLIKKFALQHEFKAILWGHSMTRLADEIISLTVKGRGSQISNFLDSTDFDKQYHSKFKNLYPLRDILLSEIDAYCQISQLNRYLYKYQTQETLLINKTQAGGVKTNNKLAKNMTINELARQYFDNIEGDYSNVISTVVRTGSKLSNPNNDLGSEARCSVCSNIIYRDGSEWLKGITVNKGHPVETEEENQMFKSWSGSQLGKESNEYLKLQQHVWAEGSEAPLCYGCIVTLNGVKNKSVVWPHNDENELGEILDEFVLTDDEGDE